MHHTSVNFLKSNIPDRVSSGFIRTCAYKEVRDANCSVFQVGEILKQAEPDEKERALMLEKVRYKKKEFFWKISLIFLHLIASMVGPKFYVPVKWLK